MSFAEKIKTSPKLKKLASRALMPKNQARPRRWVKWFLNPLIHHKGKNSLIRKRTRMDILPYNKFYLGDNSTIEDFTTINNGVGDIYIGDRTRIGLGCTLIGPVKIGNDIRLAQNIVMSGLNHNYEDISLPISDQGVTTAPIVIEDETWLGANCVVLPGVTIGKHCVIAAGSIVTKDVPSYSVAAGNPARVLKHYAKETKTWERKV
ncbi:MAG: acyltransferase [Bacteroidetes bacterium]|nr:MAG: acyltransferase [Bacteroidota bacterium]